ncbi:KOW motif-containing protein [Pseudobacillus badius]|uniref:KOW motif-containing protein n=1 Tax=Bacillus badius TaxID=1455 RepID=UPI003D334998
MTQSLLTALEILKKEVAQKDSNTKRIEVGKINRNIAFEIRMDKTKENNYHLIVVEYTPKIGETRNLKGHGLNNAPITEIHDRIVELKDAYADVAFEVGDQVKVISGKYAGHIGEVIEVQRSYKELDPYGVNFAEEGLLMIEDSIRNTTWNYEFDGYTLRLHYPEKDYGSFITKARITTSIFYAYYYTVKLSETNIALTHKGLKKYED